MIDRLATRLDRAGHVPPPAPLVHPRARGRWLPLAALGAVLLVACTQSASECTNDCPCASDQACAAPTPRCDRSSGLCVACLPAADNCGAGARCIESHGSYACAPGCAADADCRADGGATLACCGGACVDTGSEPTSCGACGHQCPALPHATPTCVAGSCASGACDPGWGDCDGDPVNGCEQDLASSAAHCGACRKACGGGAGATAVCVAGACKLLCGPLRGDCDRDPANGCETPLGADPANCGGCGRVCSAPPGGVAGCAGGSCGLAGCLPGFFDCDGRADSGCEVAIDSDPANCGGCTIGCAVANAVPSCARGSCAVGACLDHFADCDGKVANGCEVLLTSDPANCGGCGVVCAARDAVASCVAGACVISACPPGLWDCNGDLQDGCEVDVDADLANCGGCGKVCKPATHGAGTCQSGVCGLRCDAGWGDCNGSPIDGCEHDVMGDPASCGACGRACKLAHATAACTKGECTVARCDAGWADCDGDPSNGCEVDLTSDTANCGACKAACALPNAVATCKSGKCEVASCDGSHVDCDTKPENGCEIDVDNDPANCGGCKIPCPIFAPACTAGFCSALFQPTGVLTKIPGSWLGGWTKCYGGTYAATDSVDTVTRTCGKANLLLACRARGSDTLEVVAQAGRADALFDTGAADNGLLHAVNGVGWFYDARWSWGFAPAGATVRKLPCDDEVPPQHGDTTARLCWPVDQNNRTQFAPGGRCGASTKLTDGNWERLVYQAD